MNHHRDLLWAPWRMPYVGGGGRTATCIFCDKPDVHDDVRNLILWRAEHAYLVMNLYPYNTGHTMIVPNDHVDSPESMSSTTVVEMGALLPPLLRALRRALSCDGFNIGTNVGAIAGAGVASHLHEHVVPRWQGDANFMPITAATMVLPELLGTTYAKLRAELAVEMGHAERVRLVAIADERQSVVVLDSNGTPQLPTLKGSTDQAVWRAAEQYLESLGLPCAIADWCGSDRADARQEPALSLLVSEGRLSAAAHVRIVPIEDAGRLLDNPADRRALKATLRRIEATPVSSVSDSRPEVEGQPL